MKDSVMPSQRWSTKATITKGSVPVIITRNAVTVCGTVRQQYSSNTAAQYALICLVGGGTVTD